jgi:hypothetical protein
VRRRWVPEGERCARRSYLAFLTDLRTFTLSGAEVSSNASLRRKKTPIADVLTEY